MLTQFISPKPTSLLAIDIGTASLKLVEVMWRKGLPVLKNIGIKEFADQTIEDDRIINKQLFFDSFEQLLVGIHTSTKEIAIVLGGRMICVRELIVPVMTKEEVGQCIKWDLEKYIPYAPGRYYFDFAIVGQGHTENELKVLLVASPIETIDYLIHTIDCLGFTLISIDAEPLSLYRILHHEENINMVLDIGAMLSQVILFQQGSPTVIRNIPIGGNKFTQIIMERLGMEFQKAEQLKHGLPITSSTEMTCLYTKVQEPFELLVEELATEVHRTIEYYQQQNKGTSIHTIWMTGGGAKLDCLMKGLSAQLNLPVVTYNPLSKLTIPASFDYTALEHRSLQFVTAIGLALSGVDA